MFWAVVPLSWYARVYGAVLVIAIAYLVPMAAWVLLGSFCVCPGSLSLTKTAPGESEKHFGTCHGISQQPRKKKRPHVPISSI